MKHQLKPDSSPWILQANSKFSFVPQLLKNFLLLLFLITSIESNERSEAQRKPSVFNPPSSAPSPLCQAPDDFDYSK